MDRDDQTGRIYSKTELGKYMYEHLNLYLKRHSIIFMVEKLRNKRKELKESIDVDIQKGIDVSVKRQVLCEINDSFFDYYDQLCELDL